MNTKDPDQFTWRTSTTSPLADEGDHVGGVAITGLLHDAAMAYLVDALDVDDPAAIGQLDGERPILRQLSAVFESELLGDLPITIGVRAQSRTRRSFVLEAALWTDRDRHVVAVGTVSLVMFDVRTRAAVEIPPGLWAAIETIDGAADSPADATNSGTPNQQ